MTESNEDLGPEARITPRLIDALYTEAMILADEARAYFDEEGRDDRQTLEPFARVGFACESLKVTTRIMHIVAWLLTQRARAARSDPPTGAGRNGGWAMPMIAIPR
jgi:regulator of CtrA degradation